MPFVNNCAGGGAATPAGPNTALVVNPASTYINQGATGFATVADWTLTYEFARFNRVPPVSRCNGWNG